ncbi:MAG: hypothetical protein Q4Q03_00965 [Bowdeniella nasicola]|nr:hypothetical protein [Bowdeniella nasicola]
MTWPTSPVILASGRYRDNERWHVFRDWILTRLADGSYRQAAGERVVSENNAELVVVRALELILADALSDLNDTLDPWDLRLQLRSIPNASVTRQLDYHASVAADQLAGGTGAGPAKPTPCCDSSANPWFEPQRPANDELVPVIRAGYYGIWEHFSYRIRLLPGSDDCQLIAYAPPPAPGFSETNEVDAPFVRTVAQEELTALYTVEGRAVIDRHLVTICGSRPGITLATAQDVPAGEQARQIAAAARFLPTPEPSDEPPLVLPDAGGDGAPSCNVAASRPLPQTIEVDNAQVTAIRMERTDFVRTARGWQGDWRHRRPPIYLRNIPPRT